MKKKLFKAPHVLLAAFLSIALIYCSDNNEIILAKVGELQINSAEYMERLKKVREELSLPDNGEVRINFLKSYIDEQLLLTESENLGYNRDAAAVEKMNSLKLQGLLNIYLQKEVYDHIEVTNDDLKKHFAKMNIKLKVRHLYADNKKTADSLFFLVGNGVSFDKLAREVFNDPRLKETGGDLGYMGVDEMQIDFADAAYKLEIGEISRPVKTNYGYSIIKVDDRFGSPFLTENEFLKQKSAILDSYYKYAKKRAAKDHATSLQNDVRINDNVFERLYKHFKAGLSRNDIEAVSQFSDPADNEILLSSALGIWDIKTFRQKAQYTSVGQRNWIRNREVFKEYILGLVGRDQVIELAKNKRYDISNDYQIAVQNKFKEYQIDRVKKDILSSMPLTEDSLMHFYNANKGAYIDPGKANLREIVLDTPEKVRKVKTLLLTGTSFGKIAKDYSINRHTAVYGGEMGFISYNEFGPYIEDVKKLRPGDWTGPLKRGNVYFFWQCIEQYDARLKTYEEVKEEVISKYKTMRFDLAMKDKINDIRSRTEIVAYPDKLKDLKYN